MLVKGPYKGVHADIAGDTATCMGTESISDDEQDALQGVFVLIGGIGKGVVIFLVIPFATILARSEVLFLDKGLCRGLKVGGKEDAGGHSAENLKVVWCR